MSEECREQRPLLREDVSEDDQFPEYQRRRFRLLHRGRANASVKGAATIINHWPEHWTSALSHWWISLGMMALLTFIIYNSLLAFTMLPTSAQRHAREHNKPSPNTKDHVFMPMSLFPEVYMHIFCERDEQIDLIKYLPYINKVADQYLDFNFNLILVLNEAASTENVISSEENNINAWNTIWAQERINRKIFDLRKNVKLTHTTLSQYFELSPLNSDWQYISPHLFPFLVKMVAIWDIGGIAIDPDILTPRSPNAIYIEKLYNILNKYKAAKQNVSKDENLKKNVNKHKEHIKESKKMKKVNNIRDIIENLEHDSENNNSTYLQENLTEVENRKNVVLDNGRKLLSTIYLKPENNSKMESIISASNETINFDYKHKQNDDVRVRYETNEENDLREIGLSKGLNIFPLFLDFLFHDKSKIKTHKPETIEIEENLVRRRKHSVLIDKIRKKSNNSELSTSAIETTTARDKPVVISVKETTPGDNSKLDNANHTENMQDNTEELTIDLKGNIVATEASCHAFVGSVFSNAVHHSDIETVQDFIVEELSQFCKGLLSSCKGIDVILL